MWIIFLFLQIILISMYIISFTVAVLTSTFGYVVFLAVSSSASFQKLISLDPYDNSYQILLQRLIGVIIFGVFPVFVLQLFFKFPLKEFGIVTEIRAESIMWTFLLALLIIPMNFFNSKKSDNLSMYPQVRKKNWSIGLFISSSISWMAYLFAYEMLFRGFLLFSTLELIGYCPAILVNTGIYSLVHYPKGHKEAFGAVPLGLILCILTLKTGNIWIAVIVHIILALSNEYFSLWEHKKITNNIFSG